MSAKIDLSRAIDDYEKALSRSAGLGDRSMDNRRQAIQLRRDMSDRIAAIALHGREAFARSERANEFHKEFSMMRSAMAYHQASWPVVLVDNDDTGYQASVRSVREANQRFIAWVRHALIR